MIELWTQQLFELINDHYNFFELILPLFLISSNGKFQMR